MSKPDGKRSAHTCTHEAAHAVLAERLGLRVKHVEVMGTWHGRTHLEDRQKATPLAQAMTFSAGSVAEWLFHRSLKRGEMATGDRRLLGILYKSGNDRAAVIAATEHFVRRYRRSIRRVAIELRKRDLSGAQVRRLIGIR